MPKESVDLLLLDAGELATLSGPPRPRKGEEMSDLGLIKDGAVAVKKGRIVAVGPSTELSKSYRAKKTVKAKGRLVTPGLVDAHTHLLFAGTREHEFEMRILGKSYMDIAKAGGGILSTVDSVRASTRDDLVQESRPRLRGMLEHGVTTAEVKSGYGLTTGDELKMLEAIRTLGNKEPVNLISTFLGAHEVPREYQGKRSQFVDLVCKEMIPRASGLARFCDVFCEVGVFSREESRRVLETGKAHGLLPKIHAEEFRTIGGTDMAVEVGAVSADHLTAISDKAIRAMKYSSTVAVLLPGTTFYLGGTRYAPARRMIERGVALALGTDCNPGSSMSYHLPLTMSIACTQMKMTPAEALCAVTINAAYSCGEGGDVGSIEKDKVADLVIWDADNYRMIPYIYGANLAKTVIKSGKVVVEN